MRAIVVIATLLAASTVAAKKRVVVLPFTGPSAPAARNGVAKAFGKKVTQIRPPTFTAMADDLAADINTPEGIATVCAKVKCDAVVKGRVTKKGRKFTLTVTVYDGGSGEVLGRRAATVRGPRKLAAAGTAIGAQCTGLAAKGRFVAAAVKPKGSPPPQPPPPDVKPPPPKPPPPVAYVPRDEPVPKRPSKKKKKKRGDDDDAESDDDEERVTKRAPRRYAGLFDVAVAVGLSTRRATVAVTDQSATDSTYDGGMFPEFTVRADLYPLVALTRGFARNIGLGVGYTRHLSISSKTDKQNAPPVDTSSQEFLIDLRVRWAFFKTPTSPELTVFGGFGLRDFNLSENDVLASFNYKFLRFGLEGAIPFGTPYVGLFLGFDLRPLMNAGQELVDVLGQRDGGLGFAVRGGGIGRHSSGIFYFISVEYLRFSAKFLGLDAQTSKDYPNVKNRTVATEAVDRFVRFWAGAGFML